MRFPAEFLEEIKARLPVSEVVRQRVQIKKAGREWRGLSPFNAEKTPSFYVNDQKGFFHDFSSGKHGNIFDFLMETEGLTFPEAVERLAGLAGLQIPRASPENARREEARASLQEVMELAAKFYEDQLQAPRGARARGYLADRGLTPQIQRQFRLGYSPGERFALRDHLAGKGVMVEQMTEAGLLIHGEEIAVPYDSFRNRVMFPICDRAGRVIAFGGRAMEKDVQPKYKNSPDTPLFHKGTTLYNHHNARRAAHDSGRVIAVEGYVDVIAMTAAGFPDVVAGMGTALTADQCELLWKMAAEPVLCFDGDKAGQKAAWRAIDVALPAITAGKSLRFAFMPEGQDPDDLARSGGPEAIARVLAAARPLVDVLWTREVDAAQPLDTPERRAALERRLNDLLKAIGDETLRRYYREDIGERLAGLRGQGRAAQQRQDGRQPWTPGTWTPGTWTLGARAGGAGRRAGFQQSRGYVSAPPMVSPSLGRSAFLATTATMSPREASILVLFLAWPALLADHAEDLASLDLASRDLLRLRDCLTSFAADPPADSAAMREAVEAHGLADVQARAEARAVLSATWCVKPGGGLADIREVLKQALALHRRAGALHRELKSAEAALGEDPSDANLARLQEIQLELAGLEGREAVVDGFGAASGRSPMAV